MCPYDYRFGAYQNEFDEFVGGVDLSELSIVDPRWPSRRGRSLWFRLPPPREHGLVPANDQLVELEFLDDEQPDAFRDFTELLDREKAWRSPVGRYIRWLFCGPMPDSRRTAALGRIGKRGAASSDKGT